MEGDDVMEEREDDGKESVKKKKKDVIDITNAKYADFVAGFFRLAQDLARKKCDMSSETYNIKE
jgi:hypothetical protein